MKNPLNRRLPRELKSELGRYLAIFLFLAMLISLVSSFLVADNSVRYAYDEGFTKYNLEYGHLTFDKEPTDELLSDISEDSGVTLYDLRYANETLGGTDSTVRVYGSRDEVDLPCVMEGELPQADDEIALDRLFAINSDIAVGDTITLCGKTLKVSGYIALPDYSCLFENNSDMMFNAKSFGVAVMTDGGLAALESPHLQYNYAWLYDDVPADDTEEKEQSDDLLDVLTDDLTDYDEAIVQEQIDAVTEQLTDLQTRAAMGEEVDPAEIEALQNTEIDESGIISVSAYLPRYSNKAINFTGDDMGSDKATFLIFDYLVTILLAFVFAVTASNTIMQESGVIGTLRASGYSRGELVRHYMALPIIITLIAAIIGNVLGYTVLKGVMVSVYYTNYSLCTYETLWNAEAFVLTTVIPIILMFVVNLLVLTVKLRISPLNFLRHDLSRNGRKKAARLSARIPFLHRFRTRILFRNVSAYLTLFVGVFFAGAVAVFGLMFGPLLEDYAALVTDTEIAAYQYVLKDDAETSDASAERYCVTELETTKEDYMTDEIMVYGIEPDSSYVTADLRDGYVYVSNGFADKFGLSKGDTFILKDPYSDTTYEMTVDGEYTYDAALSVFMTRADYLDIFDKDEDYFTGYFSDEELTDLTEDDIAAVITEDDLTKVSDQLSGSLGEFMSLMKYFGILMFLLMMYLMTKQIIEKDVQSISMTKILGFTSGEIGGLYLVITSVVVVISLLVSCPLIDLLLRWMFHSYMYTEMTGYIPYIISKSVYVDMVLMGIVSYAVICFFMMRKIRRIPMSEALKNAE